MYSCRRKDERERKGRGENDEDSECIRYRPGRPYMDYQLIVGKENLFIPLCFVNVKIKSILVMVRIGEPRVYY